MVLGGTFAVLSFANTRSATPTTATYSLELPLITLRARAKDELDKGNYKQAIEYASQAVKLNQPMTERSSSYVLLWSCYDLANEHENALAVAKQYAQMPGHRGVEGIAHMAVSKTRLRQYKEAVALWHDVEVRGGFNTQDLHNYMDYARALRGLGDWDAAAQVIEKGLNACTPEDRQRSDYRELQALAAVRRP
jgi:tetratricopeptide (TPR) repeat protein